MSRRNSRDGKARRRDEILARGWRRAVICLDCKYDCYDEYYHVHDELWRAAVPFSRDRLFHDDVHDGMLCVGCLEGRIGRRLTPDDFTDAPINTPGYKDYSGWVHPQSARLLSRLTEDNH